MRDRQQQVVLLTGAAGGIGRHLIGCFLQRGYRVVATDLGPDALAPLASLPQTSEGQLVLRPLDVRDATAWEVLLREIIASHGSLNLLLNVAGVLRPGYVHELSAGEIDLHLDVNAKGVMYGTQAAAREMIRHGGGQIINIASLAALAPIPGIALYSASKFAVRAFSLAVAYELAPHNVRVSVICPDAVSTPMLDLQLDYPEAALTFSGPRSLSVHDVEWAVFQRAIRRGELEVIVPRRRGWLAKLSNLNPRWSNWLLPRLNSRGLKQQAAARATRGRGL